MEERRLNGEHHDNADRAQHDDIDIGADTRRVVVSFERPKDRGARQGHASAFFNAPHAARCAARQPLVGTPSATLSTLALDPGTGKPEEYADDDNRDCDTDQGEAEPRKIRHS